MALPSWREIQAPDFSNTLRALEAAKGSFSDAFTGARSTINQADQSISDRVNKAMMLQLASLNDPTTSKDAIAAMLASADPRRISEGTLNLAMGRENQLLQTDNNRLANQQGRYRWDREQQVNANQDAVRPLVNQAAMLASMGKKDEATKIFQSNPEAFGKVGINLPDLLSGNFSLLNANQGFGQRETEFGWRTTDRNEQRLAEAGAYDIASNYLTSDERAAALREQVTNGKMPGRVAAMIANQLGLNNAPDLSAYTGPGLPGGGGSPGVGGAFQFGNPQQDVASTLKAGGLSDAVVAGFLGNFHIEGGYNGAQGDGGTAGGIAQWRKDRRDNFVRIMGKDPTKATPGEQAKFVLWELNNPKAAGLKPVEIAAIKAARTPEEAAALIDKHYEISSGQHRNARISAASAAAQALGVALKTGQENTNLQAANMEANAGNPLAIQFAALSGQNGPSAREVAVQMAQQDKSIDPNWLEGAILKEMAKVKNGPGSRRNINAAMVGAAIKANMGAQSAREGLGRLIPDFLAKNTVGSDLVYDPDATHNALMEYSTGKLDDTISSNQGRAMAAQTRDQGIQAVQAIQARIQAKITAAAARGMKPPNLATDLMQLQQAQAMAGMGGALVGADGVQLPGRDEAALAAKRAADARAAEQSRKAQAAREAAARRNAPSKRMTAEELLRQFAGVRTPSVFAGR